MEPNQLKSVEEVILGLPRNEAVIVKRLRALVLECLPKAEEKVSYGVPYYVHHRMICFIWPPSIYWGRQKPETLQAKGVTLGFCQGNRMSNEDGALLAEGRKQVLCKYYRSLKEIDDAQVRAWLFEAEWIDEGFQKKRKAQKK
ncbi:MAG: DUF1801 domain-containing protein [Bacteroidota bacterium]